jgi:hypothetical protein
VSWEEVAFSCHVLSLSFHDEIKTGLSERKRVKYNVNRVRQPLARGKDRRQDRAPPEAEWRLLLCPLSPTAGFSPRPHLSLPANSWLLMGRDTLPFIYPTHLAT